MKYQLVIFDFDGTLADTYPWFTQVINKVAEKHRFKQIAADEMDSVREYSARQLIQHLCIPLWKVPIIARQMRTLMAEEIDAIRLFIGVDLLLQQLSSKGVKLALVSSNSYDNIAQVLGTVNLACFDQIECGTALFGKAVKLKKILQRSALDGREALFIGDEARDIEAAKQAGMAAGAVTWGYNTLEKLKEMRPDKLFLDMNELLAHIA